MFNYILSEDDYIREMGVLIPRIYTQICTFGLDKYNVIFHYIFCLTFENELTNNKYPNERPIEIDALEVDISQDVSLDNEGSACYSLVIPAYNEEKRIGPFLDALSSTLPGNWEIIIVCDGKDRTAEIAREILPHQTVIQFPSRLGKGGAILEGFKLAKGDIIGFVDADGAIQPNEIIKVAKEISFQYPCAIGSRWVKSAEISHPEPLFNVIAGRVFHYLTFAILGLEVKDTQCGVKFFRKDLLEEILPRVSIRNRVFDVGILYHVKLFGKLIKEVGIIWSHNSDTKLPILKVIPLMFATIFGLRLRHSSRVLKRKEAFTKVAEDFTFH